MSQNNQFYINSLVDLNMNPNKSEVFEAIFFRGGCQFDTPLYKNK